MKNKWEKRIRKYQRCLSKEPLLYELSEDLYRELAKNRSRVLMENKGKQQEKTAKAEEEILVHEVQAVVASFVMAPVLCGYLLWVLQEAVCSGKKRLYFLARDGYQMYQIAEALCKKLELPLECRYLYCSRYALRAAEYAIRREAALDYLCLGGIYVTPETVFHRAGIFGEEEIRQMAELLQIKDCKKQLSYLELKELKSRLATSMEFMVQLTKRFEAAYVTAIGYLRQEGMFDEVPYALVDSGWSGSIQQSFRHLLNHAGKAGEIEGYYFGLYEYPKGVNRSTYHTYYFSPVSELLRKTMFNNNLFECICSSPEGMTEGYCFCDGNYVPKLANRTNPNAVKVEAHAFCFVRYAEKLGKELKEQPQSECKKGHWKKKYRGKEYLCIKRGHGFLKTSERLLSLFMGNPTAEEAKEYGSYVFCDDVIGEENQLLAAILDKSEIKANRLLSQIKRRYIKTDARWRGSAWIEASTVLAYGSGRRVLWHCRVLQWVRCFRKQGKAWKGGRVWTENR